MESVVAKKAKANISVDREVWKRAKAAVALQDRTLAAFVEEAIREALKKPAKVERAESRFVEEAIQEALKKRAK